MRSIGSGDIRPNYTQAEGRDELFERASLSFGPFLATVRIKPFICSLFQMEPPGARFDVEGPQAVAPSFEVSTVKPWKPEGPGPYFGGGRPVFEFDDAFTFELLIGPSDSVRIDQQIFSHLPDAGQLLVVLDYAPFNCVFDLFHQLHVNRNA